ncbi:unnamed protein product [Vitrella brassicaformis CCMP3155]|uniref:Uncharacterized protein n=1 Tax=Vitrella brassicaformis (strain CCMP3155) TaxID=1169540 RepID=A0A0G4FFN8_VITBC|nr:unnamed protein product [Vitrella brassicaformis CCMP3155]|eukprot:CEM12031.1 unnamed protein product [Vitrella brassicaformis CCMP3155]
MSSGRPDTDMAAAGPADGGDGDEGQRGGGDERQPMDVEEGQEGRAGGGAVSDVVMRQRNNASTTEPSQMPSPAIHVTARVADGPQAAALAAAAGEHESSSSYTGVGVVKRVGSPLEHQEHKRAKGDSQTHQSAGKLPSAQPPQRPPAPLHPAAAVVGVPSTVPTLSGHAHRPPQPPRLEGGVSAGGDRAVGAGVGGDGSDGQPGSGHGRQDGGPSLPHGWKSSEKGVDVRFPRCTSDASRRLSKAIIRRTITDAQQVTDLIQPNGADPNVMPRLRVAGTTGDCFAYPLLSLAIDNLTEDSVPSIWAADDGDEDGDDDCPVALPTWRTPGLQLAVMRSLIQGGADINDGRRLSTPIRVAIASCNRAAVDLLMGQPGIQLQGRYVLALPSTLLTDQPTEAHERTLLSFYRQLIERDSTLATERRASGSNLVHSAAMTPPVYSQQFIESYIDLLLTNGADIRAVDNEGVTALHFAAFRGAHCVAASICHRLTAADINRRRPIDPTVTPLTYAAISLDVDTQQLQDNTTGHVERDRATIRILHIKTTIRVLLQAGADIALMPTATEEDRRCRQLVLPEYATVLNQLPQAIMAAVNAALRPQREMADALTEALHNATAQQLKAAFPSFDPSQNSVPPPPLPPHVDPEPSWQDDYMPFANRDMSAIAWRVASFFVNPSVLQQSPRPVQNVTEVGRRVNTAMSRFVEAAASLQVVGNKEVVGGTTNVGGERVRVPQLQCFAVRWQHSGQHRLMELREVVQRAILDEAARYDGLPASIDNGFTEDVAAFEWQQLGYVDERGQWVTLGIN